MIEFWVMWKWYILIAAWMAANGAVAWWTRDGWEWEIDDDDILTKMTPRWMLMLSAVLFWTIPATLVELARLKFKEGRNGTDRD